MSSGTRTPDPGITTPKGSLRRRVAAKLAKGIKKFFRRGDKGADDLAATSSLSDVTGGQGKDNKPLRPGIGRLPNVSAPAISASVSQMDSPRTPGPLVYTSSSPVLSDTPKDDSMNQLDPASEGQSGLGHEGNSSRDGSIIGNVLNNQVASAAESASILGQPPPPGIGELHATTGQSPPFEHALSGAPPRVISTSNRTENVKEVLGVAGRFAKTLLKKLPDLADPNPVKLALSVAKVVLEVKESIDGNKEEIATNIFNILTNLRVIEAATHDGVPKPAEAAFSSFNVGLRGALEDLEGLKSASLARKIFDYEETANKIKAIFKHMDALRIQFLTEMAMSIQETASRMAKDIPQERLYRLNPSKNADYKNVISEQAIRREECTAGTRVGILKDIEDWANDTAPDSPAVFWLTGQAGSGKTTIATTIATSFGGGVTPGQTVLGANFFCSRQFPETRNPICIIPTIAYQLARKSTPFAEALVVGNKFDAVSYPVADQLQSFFVTPWLQSESIRDSSVPYLIVIDALDELADDGSTVFLNTLFTLLNDITLKGFKIFITSRSDPRIVSLIASFSARTERWLQRVPLHEVSSDIAKYLKLHLPRLSSKELSKLESLADGLFIHAATTVRYLTPRSDIQQDEQMELLDELIQYTHGRNMSTDKSGSEFMIDILYQHILQDALSASRGKQLQRRLSAIHMLLSTRERSSSYLVSALLGDDGPTPEIVQAVVNSLHAVLYVDAGLIFWYHASFPDFIFDSTRSNFKLNGQIFTFSCDEYLVQMQLRNLCFNWLNPLKFNMCNIPSSFNLDNDHYDIDLLTTYAVINWSHHLPISGDPTAASQQINIFLQLPALFWIEVMLLVKQVDKCGSILQRAQLWIQEHDRANQNLLGGLQEVIEFTSYLTRDKAQELGIRRSTPHLYLSHLATWSKGPKIIQTWKSNFSNLPMLMQANKSEALSVLFTSGQPNQISRFVPLEETLSNPNSIAFLHHDTQPKIVSGHADGIVRIWNASSGALQRKLHGHKTYVRSVAAASDTAWIVSGSGDKTVRVWDALGGDLLHTLGGHTEEVHLVAVSQDGKRIVSGSFDKSVIIWDLASGQWHSRILTRHADWVLSVALSCNGTYAVSGSFDKTACIWDASTGNMLHLLHHKYPVNSVAISLDGTQIVSSSGKAVQLWSTENGQEIFSVAIYTGFVHSVAISPNSRTIVFGNSNHIHGILQARDSTAGQHLYVLYGYWDLHSSVTFSSNSDHVGSGASDSSIRIWDISGKQKSVLLDTIPQTMPSFEHTSAVLDSASSVYRDNNLESWVAKVDPRCAYWRLLPDGWIVSTESNDHRLMWVDIPDSGVQDPSCILVISQEGYSSIDFSKSMDMLGENWSSCYTPV